MDIPDNLIAILVPMGTFALAAFIVAAALFARHRNQELRHATIRMALDKGQPIPAELLDAPPPRREGDLPRGVKLLSVGVGLSLFLFLIQNRVWPVGLVLVALGIGYLISHRLAPPPPPAPPAQ